MVIWVTCGNMGTLHRDARDWCVSVLRTCVVMLHHEMCVHAQKKNGFAGKRVCVEKMCNM